MENRILTGPVISTWPDIAKPDAQSGRWGLSAAIANDSPKLQELAALCNDAVANSAEPEFKNGFPAGANWPFRTVESAKNALEKYEPIAHNTHTLFKGQISSGPPPVRYQGKTIDPQQAQSMLYAGAVVDLIISAAAYVTRPTSGPSFAGVILNVHAINIIDTNHATAPPLPCGVGGAPPPMTDAELDAAFGATASVAGSPSPSPNAGVGASMAANAAAAPAAAAPAAAAPAAAAPAAAAAAAAPAAAPAAAAPAAAVTQTLDAAYLSNKVQMALAAKTLTQVQLDWLLNNSKVAGGIAGLAARPDAWEGFNASLDATLKNAPSYTG